LADSTVRPEALDAEAELAEAEALDAAAEEAALEAELDVAVEDAALEAADEVDALPEALLELDAAPDEQPTAITSAIAQADTDKTDFKTRETFIVNPFLPQMHYGITPAFGNT
jgi:hypothetical protein